MADEAYRKLLKCYHDVEDRVQSRPEADRRLVLYLARDSGRLLNRLRFMKRFPTARLRAPLCRLLRDITGDSCSEHWRAGRLSLCRAACIITKGMT